MYLSVLSFLLISSGKEFIFTNFFCSMISVMASVIRSLDLELERLLELSDLIDEEDLTEILF